MIFLLRLYLKVFFGRTMIAGETDVAVLLFILGFMMILKFCSREYERVEIFSGLIRQAAE